MLALAIAALALAACGGDDGDGSDGAAASGPAAGSSPVARDGDLAARLRLDPETVAPGSSIRVTVDNLGEGTLTFGLDNSVERYVEGSWRDVSKDFGPHAIPSIAVVVKPGESSGEEGKGAVSDHVIVPTDAEPGTYRVVKHLSGDAGATLAPAATFEITTGKS